MRSKYNLRKPLILILLFLLILSNFIITVPVNAFSMDYDGLRWDEGQEVQEADVSPGGSGVATFTGTLSVDIAAGGDVEEVWVELVGSTDKGWPVSISPSTIKLDPSNEEKPFTAKVSVPQGTTYYTSGTIIVNGTATMYPSNNVSKVDGIIGTIRIKPFYTFDPSSMELIKKIDTDDGTIFNIIIENTGNIKDRYRISIENLDELTKLGFEIGCRSQIEIESNESETIQLSVNARNTVDGGEYNIDVSIKSIQEEINEGFTTPQIVSLTAVIEKDDDESQYEDLQDNFISILIIGIIFIIVIVVIIILIGLRKSRGRNRPPYNDPRMNQ